uniref:Protein MAK10 homolog n=1 Tax=Strigamia maritima TaxID=126957 RepID=T1JNY4_STRMM
MQVTWLEGHSLAQTVFTNLYLHHPNLIEDNCIKAFSTCVLKLVDIIREYISRAGVFEEEDFQPIIYGYELANDVSDMKVTVMMRDAEDELQRKVKNTRSKQGEQWDLEAQNQHRHALALFSRMKFCRLFYQALLAFGKKTSAIDEIQKFLLHCGELIPTLDSTTDLGIQPEAKEENGNKADYPTIMGFEPLVNQRLLPPTFPRYTKIKSREEAVDYFEGLINRLRLICNVVNYGTFHAALDFFGEFSKLSPCVLSRSLLQLLYLPNTEVNYLLVSLTIKTFGTELMTDVLRDGARAFISPPVFVQKSRLMLNAQAKEYVDTFLNRCVRPFCFLIKISGHNRARQRDKLSHILEDLANLQDEADKVDAFLHNLSLKCEYPRQHLACFGTWILYHTLRVMIHYVLTGFELELYSTHEYHYVFWYLFEFLYGWMVSALSRADSFLLEQETYIEQQKGRSAKKKNKKKKLRPHGREITLYQAYQNLCGGYYKALIGFSLSEKLNKGEFVFDCEQVRYEHRFAPFGSVMTPPPVQYKQFREMTDLSRYEIRPSAEEMYLTSYKYFHQAKCLFENVIPTNEEVGTLVKVAKTNFVVMKLLSGGHKKDSKDPPDFDFSLHRNFPVIKIT